MVALTVCIRSASLMVLAVTANATDFLSQRQQVTKEFVKDALLGEMSTAAGSARISAIEEELRPMYTSLPKNEFGQVESSVVRYALHRYFVQKHGWYLTGFGAHSGGVQNSSSATIVSDLAPSYIQDLLLKQTEHAGMQLRDLAVFAATMSDLIHAEGLNGLYAVYERLDMPTVGAVSLHDFNVALRGYLSAMIIGPVFEREITDRRSIRALEVRARDFYPEYDDLLMWVDDTRLAQRMLQQSRRNPFIATDGISVEEVDMLMSLLYHQFGSLQNLECIAVRESLVEIEYPDTGRVSLSKFYARTEKTLRESVDYIRNMGALDEANPDNPTVVIPNYMSSPGKCMPFSNYFSVCCPDTCESVISHVEAAVSAPSAEPNLIADVVSSLATDTQTAPRNLSSVLLSRLDQIGEYHQGHVPLHGRLFMQWLHHAYPRECPYPHASGTVNPVSQDEWLVLNEELQSVEASYDEMNAHMSKEMDAVVGTEHMPWIDVEELVAVHKTKQSRAKSHGYLRLAMMVVAVLSFALPLARACAAMLGKLPSDKVQVHMV